MSWSDLISDLAPLPVKVYKHRKAIQKYWKKILASANLGATNILILGRANAGKTVFLDCLNGNARDPNYEKPEPSKKSDNEAIEIGEWHSLFRSAPGQRILASDKIIDNAFQNADQLEGVIYIVNWGFTNYRTATTREKMIFVNGYDNIEKLRAFNLREEIEDFKLISELIKKAFRKNKNIKWLLVVLTKADLFYSKEELDKAEKYYSPLFDGAFSNLLNELLNTVGKDRLKIDVLPFCSYPENFEWNGEVIQTKIGQRENENNLIRNFYSKLKELQ